MKPTGQNGNRKHSEDQQEFIYTGQNHHGRKANHTGTRSVDYEKLERLSSFTFKLLEETENSHREKADTTNEL